MADTDSSLEEYGVGQVANVEVQDELVTFVKHEFQRAREHKERTGVVAQLIRCLRSKRCEYPPEDADLVQGVDVFIGLGALKQRAAESWLIDIIVNNIEKPWTLQATPEPDLPERLKLKVVDALIQELPSFQTFDALKDRAFQLKSAVQKLAIQAAENSTKRMENKIDDQMTEGDWTKTFTRFVGQLTTYPTAILRGPVEVGVPVAKWKGNKLDVERGSVLKVRTVSPFDAFPAPNATSAQDGSYFIERIDYSPATLHSLIGVKGFSSGNIRAVLDKYDTGYRPDSWSRAAEDAVRGKETLIDDTQAKLDIEVLIYNGRIKGKLLADKGVLVQDKQKFYECEVWVAGDYVIRAVLNPNPLEKRPLYSTSFTKVDGQFWGKGVIDLVYDTERVANAAARAMVRNMGYASGPIGEVVSERLADGDDPTDILPYKIFRVGPDLTGSGQPAFRFHNVTSIGGDLMALFEKFSKVADDLSGVPAYVLGNPQVAGAGRTLGGLSMLMGNAAKGIKNVQLNIDVDIISGVVEAFYMYNLQMSDDEAIKADAKVVARGATGLLARELAQTRTVEILQLLTPYVQAGVIDRTALQYILREVLKNTGMDIDKVIPDPDKMANLEELSGLLQGANPQMEAMERGTSTPVPLPPQSMPRSIGEQVPGAAPYPVPVNLPQGA